MRTKTIRLPGAPEPVVAPDQPALPTFAVDLILQLDQAHPHRCIGASEDLIAAHRYAAVRELIDALLERVKTGDPMDQLKNVPR